MIKRIKRGLVPIFLAVICGSVCGKLVCDIYVDKASSNLEDKKIYLIQAGAYSTYDNMVSNTNVGNYVYYEDYDGLYKAIIGVTLEYDNINKIKSTYNGDVIVSEYYSMDNDLNAKIYEYDKKIKGLDDAVKIKNVVMEMLKLYKRDEDSILLKIN